MHGLFHRLKNKIRPPVWLVKSVHQGRQQFECPVYHYHGPFMNMNSFTERQLHVEYPRCGAPERCRRQYLVVTEMLNSLDVSKMKMLHFAPEPFSPKFFPAASAGTKPRTRACAAWATTKNSNRILPRSRPTPPSPYRRNFNRLSMKTAACGRPAKCRCAAPCRASVILMSCPSAVPE